MLRWLGTGSSVGKATTPRVAKVRHNVSGDLSLLSLGGCTGQILVFELRRNVPENLVAFMGVHPTSWAVSAYQEYDCGSNDVGMGTLVVVVVVIVVGGDGPELGREENERRCNHCV